MKKRKNKFNLKDEYKKSWNYIKESKKFIYIIVGIFFAFALIGFFVPFPESLVKIFQKLIKELLAETQGMNQMQLFSFILQNNLKSSFLGMIFGFFLGIYPILIAVVNGCLLGFVASISTAEEGVSSLWRILPHGIFELPAVFIALGLGLKFGTFIFQKNKYKFFKKYFWNSLRVFLFIILPLLVLAAIIEASLIYYLG